MISWGSIDASKSGHSAEPFMFSVNHRSWTSAFGIWNKSYNGYGFKTYRWSIHDFPSVAVYDGSWWGSVMMPFEEKWLQQKHGEGVSIGKDSPWEATHSDTVGVVPSSLGGPQTAPTPGETSLANLLSSLARLKHYPITQSGFQVGLTRFELISLV